MSVTYPAGFRAAGVPAGLKASGQPDVAVVVNDGPGCTAAGVFTSNRVQAAPVLWTRECLRDGELRAVVLNSGGANACTGPDGFADTHRTAEHAARVLDCGAGDIGVCSTGLIGVRLPMPELLSGVGAAAAALSPAGGPDAALAIMTTDTKPKQAAAAGDGFRAGGMAKGAGMLAPGLATMLAVVTTDAILDAATADLVLREAVRLSFDRIDSDGCMSTNDTVLLLASGASGISPPGDDLAAAIGSVCQSLASQLIADAEGASKEIEIRVINAAGEPDGLTAARAVSRSNLFKCAIHGQDPNWGRVLAAIGTTDAAFDPAGVNVAINDIWVCRNGSVGDDRELVDLRGRKVRVVIDLGAGDSEVTLRTNDLTAAYVHENSAYSS